MTNSAPTQAQRPEAQYAKAVEALNRGQWREAQTLAMPLVRQVPSHAGVHFVAGVAALYLEQNPLAAELLGRAARLNPARADYLAQHARALSSGRFMREAVEAADRAIALAPADALTLDTLGVVYTQANEHAKAADLFRHAVELMPSHAVFRFNLATSLTFIGEIEAAECEYEACLRLEPRYWKAYLARSQLRRQSPEDNHVEAMEAALARAQDEPDARMYLNLALAKELEDMGAYERSLDCLATGKAANARAHGYTIQRDAEVFDAIRRAFDALPGLTRGHETTEPIFVIGMPRSGTTLVDRILSGHSRVSSAGELQNFSVVLKRASGSTTRYLLDADTVARAPGVDWRKLGEAYLASTRPGTGIVAHFIDKLPHNFIYAGFIARALPGAKIFCLRRNAMDTCLSNFRQLFALTSPYYDYSFDLEDTARYYVLFERLMAYWNEAAPGRILDVRYEEIVDDQAGQSRRLIEACGLPWEEGCLDFERNQAPVATASAVQVRSPIFRTSLGRWKRYGDRLDGVRRILEAAGIDVER